MATKKAVAAAPEGATPDALIAALKAENASLKAKIAELEAAMPVKRETPCIDVVVVPVDANAAVPQNLAFNGERCLNRVDDHGFTHFLVPVAHAAKVLPLSGALKYVLAESEKPLTLKLPAGLYNKDFEFLPHAFNGKEWKPIEKKESGK